MLAHKQKVLVGTVILIATLVVGLGWFFSSGGLFTSDIIGTGTGSVSTNINDTLVGKYTFDELEGTTVKNQKTGGSGATIAGSPLPVLVETGSGKALSLNGINQYASVPNSILSTQEKSLTISTKIQIKDVFTQATDSSYTPIVSNFTFSNGAQKGFRIAFVHSNSTNMVRWQVVLGDGKDYYLMDQHPIETMKLDQFKETYLNKWTTVKMMYDEVDGTALYINGSKVALEKKHILSCVPTLNTNTNTTTCISQPSVIGEEPKILAVDRASPIYFGRSTLNAFPGKGGAWFTGDIDEVQIYHNVPKDTASGAIVSPYLKGTQFSFEDLGILHSLISKATKFTFVETFVNSALTNTAFTFIRRDANSLSSQEKIIEGNFLKALGKDALNTSMLRFPGGMSSDSYDWYNPQWSYVPPSISNPPIYKADADGILLKDAAGNVTGVTKGTKTIPQAYGVLTYDRFLDLVNEQNIEPILTVNLGIASIPTLDPTRRNASDTYTTLEEGWRTGADQYHHGAKWAAQWVKCVNFGGTAAECPTPRKSTWKKVTYWEIGNETFIWLNPEEYALAVKVYSEEMRKVDPSIKIIAAGLSEPFTINYCGNSRSLCPNMGFNNTPEAWTNALLNVEKNFPGSLHYIAPHLYPGASSEPGTIPGTAATSKFKDEVLYYKTLRKVWEAKDFKEQMDYIKHAASTVRLAITEWATNFGGYAVPGACPSSNLSRISTIAEEPNCYYYSLGNALHTAHMLGEYMKSGIVDIAINHDVSTFNVGWFWPNDNAALRAAGARPQDPDGKSVATPPSLALQLFWKYMGDRMFDLTWHDNNTPKKTIDGKEYDLLARYVTKDANALYMVLLNLDLDADHMVEAIIPQGVDISSIKAEILNDFSETSSISTNNLTEWYGKTIPTTFPVKIANADSAVKIDTQRKSIQVTLPKHSIVAVKIERDGMLLANNPDQIVEVPTNNNNNILVPEVPSENTTNANMNALPSGGETPEGTPPVVEIPNDASGQQNLNLNSATQPTDNNSTVTPDTNTVNLITQTPGKGSSSGGGAYYSNAGTSTAVSGNTQVNSNMLRSSAQTCPPTCLPSSDIKDVSPAHFARSSVEYLQQRGIMQGNPDGTFAVNTAVNRAEFSKIVRNAFRVSTENKGAALTFNDVSPSEWFYTYVRSIFQAGIASGYDNNFFKPGNSIQRAEAAKMIALASGASEDTITAQFVAWRKAHPTYTYVVMPDVAVESWYAKYVLYVTTEGYVEGRTENGVRKFAPTDSITRGEAAVLVTKVIQEKGIVYPVLEDSSTKKVEIVFPE
ncbi:MAG: S-layer homology domain-containing protein [Candidatus Gracilibacteria bacterium]